MRKITSRVTRHVVKGGRRVYLRVMVPEEVIRELGLEEGDIISWDIREFEGRKVAVVRKLE